MCYVSFRINIFLAGRKCSCQIVRQSGKSYSIEYFVKKCFHYVGLNYKKYLKVDKNLLRPSKTTSLVADTSKAKKILNFKIETNLDKIISIMMENDLKIEINEK